MNSLQQLKEQILVCKSCPLWKNNLGNTPVPFSGPTDARLMICAEVPGIDELYAQEPLIGRCGKLLRKSLRDCGIDDKEVYFTNVAKCASRKGNKNVPLDKKCGSLCSDLYLKNEEYLLKPKVVMTLGMSAWNELGLVKAKSLKEIINNNTRGYTTINNARLVANYHPSYIMVHGKKEYDTFLAQIKLAKEILNER